MKVIRFGGIAVLMSVLFVFSGCGASTDSVEPGLNFDYDLEFPEDRVVMDSSESGLVFSYTQGDDYFFSVAGLAEGEVIDSGRTVMINGDYDFRLNVAAVEEDNGMATVVVLFEGVEPIGEYWITVYGTQGFEAWINFNYKPQQANIMLISVEEDVASGYSYYTFLGTGFIPGESLTFYTQDPIGRGEIVEIGIVNEEGYSSTIPVPLARHRTNGTYEFILEGSETEEAVGYQVECWDDECEGL